MNNCCSELPGLKSYGRECDEHYENVFKSITLTAEECKELEKHKEITIVRDGKKIKVMLNN